MPNTNENSIKIAFLSEGEITLEVSGIIGSFDLWAASRFLSLKGDELYINAMTAERIKTQAADSAIVRPRPGMKVLRNEKN